MRVLPVADYSEELLATLRSVSFSDDAEPNVVLLTPGHFNSAYFEHAFLADEMGIELVEGSDLFVDEGRVYMRTPRGPQRVDVIYRRVDDGFLDPLAMRPDSYLGVAGTAGRAARRPGQYRERAGQRRGRRQVDLYLCARDGALLSRRGADPLQRADPGAAIAPDDFKYVVERLSELVVKEIHGSGGKGMLVGPTSSRVEDRGIHRDPEEPAGQLHRPADPWRSRPARPSSTRAWRHAMSTCGPSCCRGRKITIIPGGLTRVALKEGSLVVNSSQGGGTKDTWVLAPDPKAGG